MGYSSVHKYYKIDNSKIPTRRGFLFWREREPIRDEQIVLGATYDDRLRLVQGALTVIREIHGKDLRLENCLDYAKEIQPTQLPEVLKHVETEISLYEQGTETRVGSIKVSAPKWCPGADMGTYYQEEFFSSGFAAVEVAGNTVTDRQQYHKYSERLDSLVAR